ncbi:MAG: metalloregulator ArsR/SmtB family transcription factor [Coriobacteriia bacterium]|nr:metalloregulator ArsR/SmtB family transcription factor [Coriobacteriia bacterium]
MPVIDQPATDEQLDAALKALASVQRREIVRMLSQCSSEPGKACCAVDEVCGCRLSEHLGLAASTISHHMSALKEAGLVTARKDGTWVYYTLDRDALSAVARALHEL